MYVDNCTNIAVSTLLTLQKWTPASKKNTFIWLNAAPGPLLCHQNHKKYQWQPPKSKWGFHPRWKASFYEQYLWCKLDVNAQNQILALWKTWITTGVSECLSFSMIAPSCLCREYQSGCLIFNSLINELGSQFSWEEKPWKGWTLKIAMCQNSSLRMMKCFAHR